MNRTFLATNGKRLARAECDAGGQWSVEFLLEGRNVRCLTGDPHDPNVVYAGTQNSGVLRSDDRGKTWRPSGMDGHIVKALAVSPAQPGLIFAGTKPPAVFVSRDGGQQWTELLSFRTMRRWFWFTPAEAGPAYVQGLAPSPTDPDVILAGVEFGAVLRSADGGKTWKGHLSGASRDCHSLAFHPTDGNWVYEGGGTGAAFSRDGGATWQMPQPYSVLTSLRAMRSGGIVPSKSGLDRIYGWAAAGDPANPTRWYFSASPGPFKAHTEGKAEAYIYRKTGDAPFEALGGGLPQPLANMPYAIMPSRAEPGHMYAGLGNGDIWHSADGGDHWMQLPVNVGSVFTAMIMLDR